MSGQLTTSSKAQSSFELGLLSVLFTFLTGLPAIIQGVRGLLDIRRRPGLLKGQGLALAGIGFGLLGTSWGVALSVFLIQKIHDTSDRMT